jgi:hypothetical protein
MDRIKKGIDATRKSHVPKVGKGRIRVELKVNEKSNNKSRMRIKACKNKDELRSALMEEKVWKITFREQTNEDRVPRRGWCGYLSVDQVWRDADAVQELDSAGALKLTETLDEMIRTSRGGIREKWRGLGITKLSNREILLSVRDTLINWSNRMTDGLSSVRWLNAKNIYWTCELWNYSEWGTDSVDPSYCELRDCVRTQGTRTNYEEWRWAMGRNMIIGARNHYYVRKGGLADDFEDAFLRAVNQAVEGFVVSAPGGTVTLDAVNDIGMGSLEGSATDYCSAFHETLKNNGLRVERVEGDGNSLFNAVAVGLGRRDEGLLVFEELMVVMENSRDEIAEYIEGPVDEYLMRLRQEGYGMNLR